MHKSKPQLLSIDVESYDYRPLLVPVPIKKVAIVMQMITSCGRIQFAIHTTTHACDQPFMIAYELAAAVDMSSHITELYTKVGLLAKSSVLVQALVQVSGALWRQELAPVFPVQLPVLHRTDPSEKKTGSLLPPRLQQESLTSLLELAQTEEFPYHHPTVQND